MLHHNQRISAPLGHGLLFGVRYVVIIDIEKNLKYILVVDVQDNHFIAQIAEILHPVDADAHSLDFVTIRKFTLSEALHHYYQMPVLPEPEEQYTVVGSKVSFGVLLHP